MGKCDCGLKITADQRRYFSYPDPVSATVERQYYATGLKLPLGFTGFMSRAERLKQEAAKSLQQKTTVEGLSEKLR